MLEVYKQTQVLTETYGEYKHAQELFLISMSTDDYDEFKSDIVKKAPSKNTIKIIYFSDQILKHSNNANKSIKYTLSQDEKNSYYKEFTFPQGFKDHLKKLNAITVYEKTEILDEVLTDFILAKTYNFSKIFYSFMTALKNFIQNIKNLVENNIMNEEMIKNILVNKEEEESIIKKYKANYERVNSDHNIKQKEYDSLSAIKIETEKLILKLERKYDAKNILAKHYLKFMSSLGNNIIYVNEYELKLTPYGVSGI